MNKKLLYAIIVLVILVIVVLAWYLVTSSGQFRAPASFDFSLSANPSSGAVTQGQSIASSITATLLKGKTQNVQLSLSGCPSATTCSLNPVSGYPIFYSTLTIVTTTGTPVGSTAITIKGVGGGKTKTAIYTLTVNPMPCTCSSWTSGTCGAGGCGIMQRQQTRSCMPTGCDVTSQCVNDSTCCSCSSWTNGACGVERCLANQRHQNRTCNPVNCQSQTQCIADSSCYIPNSCSDTDGGLVPNLKGTVSGYKNNSTYSYVDSCINNVTLTEYYCSGTSPLNTTYNCYMNTTTHCYDGVCA
jgi:hypothetical protein